MSHVSFETSCFHFVLFQFGSFRRTGNSASKRRVDKIFEKLEKREQKLSSHQQINVTELDANEMLEDGAGGYITWNKCL